ncbi:MAG: GFA family protein [Thiohalocapsa sp.]|uniref:GFA family protein n=1 Tax=Thiohalocapsa sp. TaxID=2497641 RepID=UPI0025FEF026|nr:GFA family protein [Thiohalocapsa sp.]MCG6940289.1 GFA family protein [Thiohalocapsa sp.]
MPETYKVHCTCAAVELTITGAPIVHAHCHCMDCRELLNLPYCPVAAWSASQVVVSRGAKSLVEYQHPKLGMRRAFCPRCGEVLYNTNAMGWRVVSQLLLAKCNRGVLPAELAPDKHFFYEQRVVDVHDHLPKYLRGSSGPLFEPD